LALQTEDMFSRLLIIGCTVTLGTALMINLGAAMGLLPTKGMPMPFVSYGGSALFGECILLGLVFSVQRHMPGNKRHEKRKSRNHSTPSSAPSTSLAEKDMEPLF
jgi:cell division protein FtsW